MRKIGEQWEDRGSDGKMHLYRADPNKTNNPMITYEVTDLGTLNEAGFLPEERSGQYPDISHDKGTGIYEAYLHATLLEPAMSAVLVRVQASSLERLKLAWNRRVCK
ncbi:MAG: hypothetical protein ACQ5SW_12360 [Sphaerochaetaceae bacterium]